MVSGRPRNELAVDSLVSSHIERLLIINTYHHLHHCVLPPPKKDCMAVYIEGRKGGEGRDGERERIEVKLCHSIS